MQDRAKEIVGSKDYLDAMNKRDLFFDKTYSSDADEPFFTEDLIDVENQTYNYDLINKKLHNSSFQSAEEFVKMYEDLFYSMQNLMNEYPDLKNSLLL